MFHETPKSSMEQSLKAGYMIKIDKTFEFHETKFHRVVWALAVPVEKLVPEICMFTFCQKVLKIVLIHTLSSIWCVVLKAD